MNNGYFSRSSDMSSINGLPNGGTSDMPFVLSLSSQRKKCCRMQVVFYNCKLYCPSFIEVIDEAMKLNFALVWVFVALLTETNDLVWCSFPACRLSTSHDH
jgi:hypothetical protein